MIFLYCSWKPLRIKCVMPWQSLRIQSKGPAASRKPSCSNILATAPQRPPLRNGRDWTLGTLNSRTSSGRKEEYWLKEPELVISFLSFKDVLIRCFFIGRNFGLFPNCNSRVAIGTQADGRRLGQKVFDSRQLQSQLLPAMAPNSNDPLLRYQRISFSRDVFGDLNQMGHTLEATKSTYITMNIPEGKQKNMPPLLSKLEGLNRQQSTPFCACWWITIPRDQISPTDKKSVIFHLEALSSSTGKLLSILNLHFSA